MTITKPHLCNIEGCENIHYGLGYCHLHWSRFKTHGDALFKRKHGSKYKHGMVATSEYYSWGGMLRRTENTKNPHYQYYGARGIKVCERWHDFRNFYEDMGDKPSPKHSVERLDNNGNYEPSNCVWALPSQQNRNKRTPRNNTLGFKGVSYRRNSYWARLIVDKRTYVRAAKSLEEAIVKRKELEQEFWI